MIARIPLTFIAQLFCVLLLDFFVIVIPIGILMYFLTWIGLPEIAVMPLSILVLLLVGASIVWLVIYDIRNYPKVFGLNKLPDTPKKT